MKYLIMAYNREGWCICVPGVREVDGMPTLCWRIDMEGYPDFCGDADVEMAIELPDEVDAVFPRKEKTRLDALVTKKMAEINESQDALRKETERGLLLAEDIGKLNVLKEEQNKLISVLRSDVASMVQSVNFSTLVLCRVLNKYGVTEGTLETDPILTAAERLLLANHAIDEEILKFLDKLGPHVYMFSDRLRAAIAGQKKPKTIDNDEIPF